MLGVACGEDPPAVPPCSALNPAFPHPSPLPEGEGTQYTLVNGRVFALSGGATNALLPPLPLGEGWGEGLFDSHFILGYI